MTKVMRKDIKEVLRLLRQYADPPSSFSMVHRKHLRVSWNMTNDDGEKVTVSTTHRVTGTGGSTIRNSSNVVSESSTYQRRSHTFEGDGIALISFTFSYYLYPHSPSYEMWRWLEDHPFAGCIVPRLCRKWLSLTLPRAVATLLSLEDT
jgi:hypothetical protein